MDVEEFRQRGKEMVDIIADYYSTIRDRRVLPDVKPGFMISLIPSEAPHEPETWQDVVKDIERVIMPGVRSRQSSNVFLLLTGLLLDDSLAASSVPCILPKWILFSISFS